MSGETSGNVIELEGVWKRYMLGTHVGGRRTAWQSLRSALPIPGADEPSFHDALADVSLSVAQGETVGLVGRNGSGKSTLLKIIGSVTAPTRGSSRTRGKVGSLLEVGAGFYSELTGRENVYVVGSILGMRPSATRERFADIVDFAELDESLMDTPVKRLSSGQYLRLAFAVSAHLDSDIMLVDEVLAVGDYSFQQKCLAKMRSLAVDGRSVVFVSHQLQLVADLCDRVVWLNDGRKVADGPTNETLTSYRSHRSESDEVAVAGLRWTVPTVADHAGRPQATFERNQPIRVTVEIDVDAAAVNSLATRGTAVCSLMQAGLVISRSAGYQLTPGPNRIEVDVAGVLGPGGYEVAFHVVDAESRTIPVGEPAVFHVVAADKLVHSELVPGLLEFRSTR